MSTVILHTSHVPQTSVSGTLGAVTLRRWNDSTNISQKQMGFVNAVKAAPRASLATTQHRGGPPRTTAQRHLRRGTTYIANRREHDSAIATDRWFQPCNLPTRAVRRSSLAPLI